MYSEGGKMTRLKLQCARISWKYHTIARHENISVPSDVNVVYRRKTGGSDFNCTVGLSSKDFGGTKLGPLLKKPKGQGHVGLEMPYYRVRIRFASRVANWDSLEHAHGNAPMA